MSMKDVQSYLIWRVIACEYQYIYTRISLKITHTKEFIGSEYYNGCSKINADTFWIEKYKE